VEKWVERRGGSAGALMDKKEGKGGRGRRKRALRAKGGAGTMARMEDSRQCTATDGNGRPRGKRARNACRGGKWVWPSASDHHLLHRFGLPSSNASVQNISSRISSLLQWNDSDTEVKTANDRRLSSCSLVLLESNLCHLACVLASHSINVDNTVVVSGFRFLLLLSRSSVIFFERK
jgi:hypothetical protein